MSTSPTRPRAPQARATDDIERYLRALFARESPGAFIEVRYRHRDAMRRHFFAHTDTYTAARTIARLGLSTDVYVGVAARRSKHAGGKDAIRRVWTLWADLDDADARERLEQLPVAPAIVIAQAAPGTCTPTGRSHNPSASWPQRQRTGGSPRSCTPTPARSRTLPRSCGRRGRTRGGTCTPTGAAAAGQHPRPRREPRLAARGAARRGHNAATILRPPGTYSSRPTRRPRSSSASTRSSPRCTPRPPASPPTRRRRHPAAPAPVPRRAARTRCARLTPRTTSARSPARRSAGRARSAAPSTRTARRASTSTSTQMRAGTVSAAGATATPSMTSQARCGSSTPAARASSNCAPACTSCFCPARTRRRAAPDRGAL